MQYLYVDPDAAFGGNGSDASPYMSIASAEAALPASPSDSWTIVCRSQGSNHTADTLASTLTFGGSSFNATNRLFVTTDTASKAGASWSATKYRLAGANLTNMVNVAENYVILDGLQMEQTGISANNQAIIQLMPGSGNYAYVQNCLLKLAGGSSFYGPAIWLNSTGATMYVRNTIAYNAGAVASNSNMVVNAANGTAYLENCTIIGYRRAVSRSVATLNVTNCYGVAPNGAAYVGTMTMTTCASADTSGSTGLQNIAYSTATFSNVTAGSENLSLATNSALIGVGTDLSSNFTTDMAGVTRSIPWDIGALEYVAAGGTTHPLDGVISGLGSVTVAPIVLSAALGSSASSSGVAAGNFTARNTLSGQALSTSSVVGGFYGLLMFGGGTAHGVQSAAANVAVTRSIAASAVGGASTSGLLRLLKPLLGATTGGSSVTDALLSVFKAIAMYGVSACSSIASGTASIISGLFANSSGTSSATSGVQLRSTLAGASSGVGSTSGSVQRITQMGASSVGSSAGSGLFSTIVQYVIGLVKRTGVARAVRDSFLRYIADNVGGIPVHAQRRDSYDPSTDILEMNAINVKYDDWKFGRIAEQKVYIDILSDDENTAVEWMELIGMILEVGIAPLYDYSDPSNPVSLNRYISWSPELKFIKVANDHYCHYSLELTIHSQR